MDSSSLRGVQTSSSDSWRPFLHVPNEILQEIFDYCCDVNHFRVFAPAERINLDSLALASSLRGKPALVLSSVNSKWRSNALAMPRIWARIKLEWYWHLREGGEKYKEEDVLPLIAFLKRSLQSPMAISLRLSVNQSPNVPRDPGHVVLPAIPQPLIPHMHRWQSFDYDSESFPLEKSMFSGANSLQFPQLIEMTIMGIWSQGVSAVICSAPNLKRVAVERGLALILLEPFRDSVKSRFAQLSHLHFLPAHTDMSILSDNAANLLSLSIESDLFLYYRRNTDRSPPSAYCPSIKTLTVRHWHCDPPIANPPISVFSCITLPSLKTLAFKTSVHSPDCSSPWTYFDPLLEFVERSRCSLTTLSLESLPIYDLQLVLLLSHLPTLCNLTVSDIDFPYEFSPITSLLMKSLHAHFTSSSYSTPLVPKLCCLKINTSAVATSMFSDASVVDMVQSRWIPDAHNVSDSTTALQVACLREFTMIFRNRDQVSDIYESLEELERDGMRVVVKALLDEQEGFE